MRLLIPNDGWGKDKNGKPIVARAWQSACMPKLLNHYVRPRPPAGIVSAIMGSGKARAIAQMLAHSKLEPNEVIVVSAPTILLVQQLTKTLRARLDGDFFSNSRVGSYYTNEKDIGTEIIVACTDSLGVLAEILKRSGRRCVLWIIDEAHTGENKTTYDAYTALAPERLLGFTATPFLADERRALSLFKVLLYKYRADEAMKDGVVCPWVIKNFDGSGRDENGDGVTLNQACIDMARKHVWDLGPGLFNAFSIADAIKFTEELRATGKAVEAVHSKLTETEITRRLADLESGKLWAVVYVHLLSAGFDMPVLKFVCLRRPISSRVTFAQSIGRILRSHPETNKKEAIILDPHDLFSVFSITPEEALGGDPPDDIVKIDESLSESEKTEQQLSLFADEVTVMMGKVRAGKIPLDVKPMQTYLTTLVSAFDVCGLTDRKLLGHSWRSKATTRKQQSTIANMNWVSTGRKCIPRVHQRALRLITGGYEQPGDREKYAISMNRGTGSDLIDILQSLAKKKQWPDVKNLDAAASDSLKRSEDAAAAKPKVPTANPLAPPPKPAPSKLQQGTLFENTKPKVMQ